MRSKGFLVFFAFALVAFGAAFWCGEALAALPSPWGAGLYFGAAAALFALASFAGMLVAAPAWRAITRRLMVRAFLPFAVGACLVATGCECLYTGQFRLPSFSTAKSYPVSFCIDVSGSNSLTDPSLRRRDAMIAQLRASDGNLSAAITVFDDAPRLLLPLTPLTATAVENAVSLLEDAAYIGGGTDIASAIRFAEAQLGGARGLVALYTDGEDAELSAEADALAELLQKDGVTLSVIQLGDKSDAANGERRVLRRLAEDTGGQYVTIDDVDTLSLTIGGVVETARAAARASLLYGESPDGAHTALRAALAAFMALLTAACAVVLTNHRRAVPYILTAGVLGAAVAACAVVLLPRYADAWPVVRMAMLAGVTLPALFAQGLSAPGLARDARE